jgi:acyl-CoA reductase-like NAD-dependent aldehyde dehydrogenase
LINKFADALVKHKEELIHLECTDNGKSFGVAAHDVDFAVQIFRYNAGACERLEGLSFTRDSGEYTNNYGYVRKEPIGVAGCITPWNFPLLMTTFKMAPLLASGSTGIFKTPELTPLSSLKMAEIWTNIEGTVPGVINMLPGIGSEAGEALVDHPEVNSIHFTGSTAIGQRIMSRAAATMKRVKLELGGKSPLIVFDDANIVKAATIGAIFGTVNTG